MESEKREKDGLEESRPERKVEPKRDYRRPKLTKFGPVEEFTGSGSS
jgi:hypothetical protein